MKVKIKKGNLIISIPLKNIKAGLEGHPMEPMIITDINKMGEFYKKAVMNETCNDGNTTFFEDMLDKIGNAGIEGGEEGFELPGERL